MMPFLKSMDPVEGRNIATWEMLPLWEGFTVDGVSTSMSAWEAIEVVRDLAYCMTHTQAEEYHGSYKWNVPSSYDFSRVRFLLYNCYPNFAEVYTIKHFSFTSKGEQGWHYVESILSLQGIASLCINFRVKSCYLDLLARE